MACCFGGQKAEPVVAVVGATGAQGKGVVDRLLAKGGYKVRALTRDPSSEKAKALAARGVECVKGDAGDLGSLKAAFAGADAVFAVTDFWGSCKLDTAVEKAHGRNMVDAAAAAGVGHFVWSTLEDTRPLIGDRVPSVGEYKTPHFDAKAEIEIYAREKLGKKLTNLLTIMYMDNYLPGSGCAPQKQEDGSYAYILPVNASASKIGLVASEDIGACAAEIIAAGPKAHGGKTVPVTGDSLTLDEICAAVAKLTGKTVKAITPPADAWIATLVSYGFPQVGAQDFGNMMVYYSECAEKCNAMRPVAATKKVLPGVLSFEAWLAKNKAKFVEGMP